MRISVRIGLLLVLLLLVAGGATLYARYFRTIAPAPIGDPLEHFKYGSIGAEVDGLPYSIWRILPRLVPDKLPGGWRAIGFLYEPGHALPIGISVRRFQIDRVGFNCATCHTNRLEGSPAILLGAPAEGLDLQRYLMLLVDLPHDPRFNNDAVIAALRVDDPGFDWIDTLVYRWYILPKLRSELVKTGETSAWMRTRAPHGPGRTDAGNSWRQRFGLKPLGDTLNGVTDFPHIWMQSVRTHGWAHWDGNNGSLTERNLSAALAGGARPDSLDHGSIERVAAWTLEAPAPHFPLAIDTRSAARGRRVYDRLRCGICHDPGAPQFGQVTDIAVIGTDRDRYDVFSKALLDSFTNIGTGYPWRFTHYRKSSGYINMPLDGIWARGPYLHNGSVPTLDALLRPATERPRQFLRGCVKLDPIRVGFTCETGVSFDTARRGNGNQGHVFGTTIADADRRDLIEYLKSR